MRPTGIRRRGQGVAITAFDGLLFPTKFLITPLSPESSHRYSAGLRRPGSFNFRLCAIRLVLRAWLRKLSTWLNVLLRQKLAQRGNRARCPPGGTPETFLNYGHREIERVIFMRGIRRWCLVYSRRDIASTIPGHNYKASNFEAETTGFLFPFRALPRPLATETLFSYSREDWGGDSLVSRGRPLSRHLYKFIQQSRGDSQCYKVS